MSTELAITEGQTTFTDKQLAALRQLGVDGASNADVAIFFHHCVRTGLDPFARQIYMIERQGKQTIQTGIDGFRLIARRAAEKTGESLGYEDTLWCGTDGKWFDVWLAAEHPAAAKVTVIRNGERFPAVALWSEYVALKRDGSITQMWKSKGALMLAKCAEALALRKAFPQDLSGLYTSDEMQATSNPRVIEAEPAREASGRDWAAEAEQIAAMTELPDDRTHVDLLRDLWAECAAWGELTDQVKQKITALVEASKVTEQATDSDPVDAVVVSDEQGTLDDGDPWNRPAA